MQILYADIFFVLNFCMDFFAIALTGKILHIKLNLLLALLASALGGIYSVITTVYAGNSVISLLTDIGCAFLICLIAYYKAGKIKVTVKITLVFYIVSLLLGGIITFFYNTLNKLGYFPVANADNELIKVAVMLLLGGIAAVSLKISNLLLSYTVKSKSVSLDISIDGRRVTFEALVDSGNFLVDPISGKKVIITLLDAVEALLPFDIKRILKSKSYDISDISMQSARRIRLIPAVGIGGAKTYIGIVPDSIIMRDNDGSKKRELNALIAVENDNGGSFGGYSAVMPSVLIC